MGFVKEHRREKKVVCKDSKSEKKAANNNNNNSVYFNLGTCLLAGHMKLVFIWFLQ